MAQRRPAAGEDRNLIAMCYNSDDSMWYNSDGVREGVNAFLSKRAPTWTGT